MNQPLAVPDSRQRTVASRLEHPPQERDFILSRSACFHGGTFFNAVGEDFDDLGRRHEIINADVLDAWFPPSPKVLSVLQENLSWLIGTSPPTQCDGFIRAIAKARGVEPDTLLPGAGSSDLIFRVFGQWLDEHSRVLILDPTYGEYSHILRHVLGCRADCFPLRREDHFRLDQERFTQWLSRGYDLVVLVNPNSPTGQHVEASALRLILSDLPPQTRVWLDETYVDYAGSDQSLEQFASASGSVFVCKSMSKAYGLSGVRAAYLCGPPRAIHPLRQVTPPWVVGLPAQVAAVHALKDAAYYENRWKQTHQLREQLADRLRSLDGLRVIPSVANFFLLELPANAPTAKELLERCAIHGLHLRDASTMGAQIGEHTIRVAVKDTETNERMARILASVLKKS